MSLGHIATQRHNDLTPADYANIAQEVGASANGWSFFSLTFGVVVVGISNWESSADLPVNLVLGLAGITLCVVGFRLLLVATEDGPPIQVDGAELGCVQLNGYYLVAYECETPDGRKQFRLASSSTFTQEREAALIRYLALEGFLVSLWPEMRERLQEETEWAFLGY